MNEEEDTCPFCHGTGKMKTQNCLAYYFDNTSCAQPVNMNIRYTINTCAGDNCYGLENC